MFPKSLETRHFWNMHYLNFQARQPAGKKLKKKNYCEQSDLTDIFVSKLNDLIFLKNFLLLK